MKITYLFGAGASKNALPIVNEIPERLKLVIDLLKSEEFKLPESEKFEDLNLDLSKRKVQNVLIEDFEWLLDKSANHASIDTFAKKLFIKKERNDLDRLKLSFSVYFIIEQFNNKVDMRYDSFYASLLKDSISNFPKNVRVLSWNYDVQFEKAFSEYTNRNDYNTNQTFLNVITKYGYDTPNDSRFSILKLNGSTNLMQSVGRDQYQYFSEFQDSLTTEVLSKVVRNYASLRLTDTRGFSGLSFAWERFGEPEKDIVLHAKNETANAEILIVIGYSFPYFNREIDREIIQNMKHLKKVYFQAPDAEHLKERFLSIREDLPNESLVTRFDVEQFLLPNEL
ncbi:SIR2 family protein [Reichenbachiella agariperforans]|uniref:SIR2 family protein n=1 Tax=Reichenbachiella agariperforans TaxID=156994 RepID=UPI001C09B36B|nr:SIR2 family protein [Reichenbachiella agariperforans]MBU2915999.1 SIR2 family protein [Reichenbachiella agariperforans]